MSTIDEIMIAAMDYADERVMVVHRRGTQGGVHRAVCALREMITAAIAEARREGAEAMREAIAAECSKTYTIPVPSGDVITEVERECYPNGMKAGWIRSLPLPTGKRQAVRLTDEQIVLPVIHGFGATTNDWASHIEYAHAIESAVLAANGLGDGDE